MNLTDGDSKEERVDRITRSGQNWGLLIQNGSVGCKRKRRVRAKE
jgi:hypothetical protein